MFYEKIDYNRIPELAKKMETFFCQNPNKCKTSYMNWRMGFGGAQEFAAISEGYAECAIQLIDLCLEDNSDRKADIWIFPIFHCIIHSIELYLKAIHFNLCILLEEKPTISADHNIKQICEEAKAKILTIKNGDFYSDGEFMYTAIKVVHKFIVNIYDKTNDMSFARYPISSKKKKMFYSKKTAGNIVVDLEKMREQFSYVFMMLDSIMSILYNNLEFLSEISKK